MASKGKTSGSKKRTTKKTSTKKTANPKPKKTKSEKPKLKDLPKYMTIEELSNKVKIPIYIIWDMIYSGELYVVVNEENRVLIPTFQLGRFLKEKDK